jgi:hypothetical protein
MNVRLEAELTANVTQFTSVGYSLVMIVRWALVHFVLPASDVLWEISSLYSTANVSYATTVKKDRIN